VRAVEHGAKATDSDPVRLDLREPGISVLGEDLDFALPRTRLTLRYVVSCWVEGTTKADVTALHGRDAMSDDRRYLVYVLVPGIARRLRTAARRLDRSSLLEAVVLSVAAQVTAAGYLTRTLAYPLLRVVS
jgi:hypothetical protein